MVTDIKMKIKNVTESGHNDRLKVTSTLAKCKSTQAFKSIQMTYSLKQPHRWFSNHICSMMMLQGFKLIKISPVENPKWPLMLKMAELVKSTFSPKPLVSDIFD